MSETTVSTGIEKLHAAIARGKASDGIALTSHAVVGYPSPEENLPTIAALVEAGADLMEIQFPFSDPLADGPILTAANQKAVDRGVSTDDCFALLRQASEAHPDTAFIAMTYYNVIYRRGVEEFVREAAEVGVAAIIVPDLPPEESQQYRDACDKYGVGTIFLITPVTSRERMAMIGQLTTGFVYCIGRPGVSGAQTAFDGDMSKFIEYVESVSNVPVGVGFGVRTHDDVAALKPIADIVMVCTEVIRRIDIDGVESTATYLAGLR